MSTAAYVHPGNGPARAKAQRKALDRLAMLNSIDPLLAARTLHAILRSDASDRFKRRAIRLVNRGEP